MAILDFLARHHICQFQKLQTSGGNILIYDNSCCMGREGGGGVGVPLERVDIFSHSHPTTNSESIYDLNLKSKFLQLFNYSINTTAAIVALEICEKNILIR